VIADPDPGPRFGSGVGTGSKAPVGTWTWAWLASYFFNNDVPATVLLGITVRRSILVLDEESRQQPRGGI